MEDLEYEIEYLKNRKELLDAGEELCDHHWNGSDRCYETYCTGCKTHTGEIYNENHIPFRISNFCFECQKTTEEKELERIEHEKAVKESELKTLASLVEKYPSYLQAHNLEHQANAISDFSKAYLSGINYTIASNVCEELRNKAKAFKDGE